MTFRACSRNNTSIDFSFAILWCRPAVVVTTENTACNVQGFYLVWWKLKKKKNRCWRNVWWPAPQIDFLSESWKKCGKNNCCSFKACSFCVCVHVYICLSCIYGHSISLKWISNVILVSLWTVDMFLRYFRDKSKLLFCHGWSVYLRMWVFFDKSFTNYTPGCIFQLIFF